MAVDTTIFPRINFLKTFSSRLAQRIANGRVAMFFKRLFSDATLDLNFASTKSLTDSVSGDNLVTFTRSSTATYVDSSGVIQTAAIDAPRFDHDPETGESLGLLVEESRTNSILNSGNWSSFATVKQNMATNATTTTAPDGVTTVSQIQSSSSSFAVSYQIVSLTAGTTYTISAFFKAGNFSSARLRIRDADFFATGTFDLSTGTASSGAVIQELPDGWYRCSVSGVATSTTSTGRASFDFNDPVSVGSTIYIWGAQLETGSFPTSYIPTAGSTVTRAADVASITGSNFSSWYNQSEGTWFGEVKKAYPTNQRLFEVGDSVTSQYSVSVRPGPTSTSFARQASNATTVNHSYPAKIAVADSVAEIQGCVNGTLASIISSGTSPTDNKLSIGGVMSVTTSTNAISRLAYFPTRLTDSELQDLTS